MSSSSKSLDLRLVLCCCCPKQALITNVTWSNTATFSLV